MSMTRKALMQINLDRAPSSVAARGRWRAASLLSLLLALLAGSASLAGLVVEGVYAGPVSVVEMLRGFDLVTLVVVVPALVVAQLWARRGSARAQLVWLGMLAYLVYTYAYYLFGALFNDVFLLHAAVFASSLLALILTVVAADIPAIGAGFAPRTPRRLISVVLGLLAVGLGGMWAYSVRFAVIGELPAGSALVEPDLVVHLGIALDLALLVPAYALAAVLLWRGVAAGFVLASVVLVSGTLHQISYMVAMPFQAAADVPGAVAFDPAEPAIAALFTVATALLLWRAGQRRGGTTNGTHCRFLRRPTTPACDAVPIGSRAGRHITWV